MRYRLKVFPYKLGSVSAKSLANSLGVKRVRPTYDARRRDIIINWGNSRPSEILHAEHDLNKHSAIALACNKLKTFQTLDSQGYEYLPSWATSRYGINNLWEGYLNRKVYCRTSLTGHSGSGIVIATNTYELVDAPLYTIEVKHKYEYRVHVFKGKVIDVQQKKKKIGSTSSNSGIRNHSNGWIYARCDVVPPDCVLTAATEAVTLLGLDFGACDIGYRERDNKAFLFEVNTAPGLYGTTLQKYVQTFKEYLNEMHCM
jgi:glutathione synthase/RimK-type ligase-like ATP-grasp enzyme